MKRETDDLDYDLSRIIVRPLYFGIVVNLLLPVVGLFVCYYIHMHGGRANSIGQAANTLFYIFGLVALAQAGFALWWRKKLFGVRMVTVEQKLEDDLTDGLLKASRPVFIVIATISIYGYVYFYLTGRFSETLVFVLFSFVIFQIVRPRYGTVRKLIARQRQLLKQPG